mmetsp:Transcript_35237/g.51451  ORF Transcript_35237/g.51451 Transcript_35237/m.51451 type:complete len:128 (-) Transcript_35237:448-831(-)
MWLFFAILFAKRRLAHITSSRCYIRFVERLCLALATCVVSSMCAYSRVRLGHHTIPQVCVGLLYGSFMGIFSYIGYEFYFVTTLAPWIESFTILQQLGFHLPDDLHDAPQCNGIKHQRYENKNEKSL